MLRIGVVIPAFNVGGYIYDCLRSCVYDDADENVTIHVTNDGSSDNTQDEIDRFCKDYPSVSIRVFQTDRVGPGSARNVALDNLNSKYLIFVDGDDLISRDNLSVILDKMDASGADICCPNIVAFDDAGKFKFDFDRPAIRDRILSHRSAYLTNSRDNAEILGLETSMCMRIFRKSFYDSCGLEFSNVRFCEDVLPSRKALLLASKILVVSDDYYFYRLNRISQRTSSADETTMDLASVISDTMSFALDHIVDNEQGGWTLNRLSEAAVWGASLISPKLLQEYASRITDALEKAPMGWWSAFEGIHDVAHRQKAFAPLYLKRRSRVSKERIIYSGRYRFVDRIALNMAGA
ncbi:glycosyltransferase family 2 protein [Brucella tritici]|uniref:glycosyltransferase family 2 protein n=1 Tax=Brucella tritici TaxID=94626 RepID=UPI003D6CBBA4